MIPRVLACLLLLAPAVFGQELEFDNTRPPPGRLGFPIGSYLSIEGVRGPDGFLVDRVNGMDLGKPRALPLFKAAAELPEGQRALFRGYETAHWRGVPEEAVAEGWTRPREALQLHRGFVGWVMPKPYIPLTSSQPAPEPDPAREPPPEGKLGQPIGTYVEVAGRRYEQGPVIRRLSLPQQLFTVTRVNDRPLADPVVIRVHNLKGVFPEEGEIRLRGFETVRWTKPAGDLAYDAFVPMFAPSQIPSNYGDSTHRQILFLMVKSVQPPGLERREVDLDRP
jgi:hypothetical protein